MRPKYVKEAARLLKKSIIHVESENIVLGDDSDAEDEDEAEEVPGEKEQGPAPLVMSFEDYQRMANLIVLRMRQNEDAGTVCAYY